MDLNINKYYIKEIKYRVNSKKTAIFKLRNFNIVDIEIIEENNDDDENVLNIRKSKDLNLYLENEKQIDSPTPTIEKNTKIDYTSIPHFSNEKIARTKELIDKTKDVPYKVYEKIGNLDYNLNTGEFSFQAEPDQYVVNDEREIPKQKTPKIARTEALGYLTTLYDYLNKLKECIKQIKNSNNDETNCDKINYEFEDTLKTNLNHLKMQTHFTLDTMKKEDEEKEKNVSMFDKINLNGHAKEQKINGK